MKVSDINIGGKYRGLYTGNIFEATDCYKNDDNIYIVDMYCREIDVWDSIRLSLFSNYFIEIDLGESQEEELDEENSFDDILSSIGDMLREKDKRYGNSALKPLGIFADHHPYGARLDEKLARVKNSDDLRKNDVADIIGGLVLICRDNDWTDFSDQID